MIVAFDSKVDTNAESDKYMANHDGWTL